MRRFLTASALKGNKHRVIQLQFYMQICFLAHERKAYGICCYNPFSQTFPHISYKANAEKKKIIFHFPLSVLVVPIQVWSLACTCVLLKTEHVYRNCMHTAYLELVRKVLINRYISLDIQQLYYSFYSQIMIMSYITQQILS